MCICTSSIHLIFVVLQIIDKDINPHVDEWEEAGIFPAHKLFKILGDAGVLGVTKPTGKY